MVGRCFISFWGKRTIFQGGYPIFNSRVLGSKRCPSFSNSQKKHVNKNARKINLVVFCWSYLPYFLSTKKTDPNVRRFPLKRISQIFLAVSQETIPLGWLVPSHVSPEKIGSPNKKGTCSTGYIHPGKHDY